MWNVMCNVSKVVIDVDKRCGYLYLPKDNVPDMRRTIECLKVLTPRSSTFIHLLTAL